MEELRLRLIFLTELGTGVLDKFANLDDCYFMIVILIKKSEIIFWGFGVLGMRGMGCLRFYLR